MTQTNQQGAPEALRTIAEWPITDPGNMDAANMAAVARAALVEAQQLATHVQQSAEIEHVAGDVSKNGAEVNMSTQQAPQQPCPTCAALARTVMLDQVSFDRKPDCYGIRQITDDESVEEWEDIRTSPDVAREEANDMMATGRGEIYEVVPLWTTPQPSTTPQADSQPAPDQRQQLDAYYSLLDAMGWESKRQHISPETWAADLLRDATAYRAARATAPSVLEDAARLAKIMQAIRDYHFALDNREHGGVAMARAWNAICDVLNMDWVQGAESAARKQGGA